jgi:hypothetical protein
VNELQARAWLCQALPTIRKNAAGTAHSAQVDVLLTAARDGQDIAAAADKLRRELGLPQPAPVRGFDQSAMVGIGGMASGHPVPETFACPGGKCPRIWTRQPGMTAPECHLFGGRLA